MSLSFILIVVVCIMSIFAAAIFLVAKQNNFSTKQTIDPRPAQTHQREDER